MMRYAKAFEASEISIIPDGKIPQGWLEVTRAEYEAEQAKKEQERIQSLSMTRGDVFEALILAKGLGKTQLRAMIEAYETDEITKLLYLNRFDEALDFYRGYPIFDLLGEQIGITPEQWDRFFDETDKKNPEAYKELLPRPAEEQDSEAVEGVNDVSNSDNEATSPVEKEVEVASPSNIEDIIAES